MTKKVNVFKIGDRVGMGTSEWSDEFGDRTKTIPLRYNPDGDGLQLGTVFDITSKGKILVEWDDWGSEDPLDPSQLLTETDAKAKWSELEKEFDEVEKQIKVKVKEVAAGIREANKLAKKTGRTLSEMYDVVYGDLYNAMDAAGWRTSSFGC